MNNKRTWMYSGTGKILKFKSGKVSQSPARKRCFDLTPKRNFIVMSKSRSNKDVNKSYITNASSGNQSPSESKSPNIFKPSTRVYIELSESPVPYDLKSKNVQKDIELFEKLIVQDSIDEKKNIMRKEFKKLVKKEIKKVESEREEFLEMSFEDKKSHPKASEYFKEIRRGNVEKVIFLLISHPELIKEVDSTHQTGLHWAVRRRNIPIIKYLLMSNINIMSKDIVGRRAEDIARSKKYTEISEFLIGLRRRTGQNVSRILTSENEATDNTLQMLMRMKTRVSKRLIVK